MLKKCSMSNKILCVMLSIALVIGLMPSLAFASEKSQSTENNASTQTEETKKEDTSKDAKTDTKESVDSKTKTEDTKKDVAPLAANPVKQEASENVEFVPGEYDGTYYIGASGAPRQVIDVAGGSTANAVNIQLYQANQTNAQKWTIKTTTDGYVMIFNGSGKVMDVAGGQAKAGTSVWQYTQNDSAAQKWKVIPNQDGTFTFESALGNNLVLDLAAGQTANGTNVQIYTKNDTPAQKFNMYNLNPKIASSGVHIDNGFYNIQSNINKNYYVDLDGGKSANGTNIHLWSGDGQSNDNQIFKFEKTVDGFYVITNCNTNKAIDVSGSCVLPGTNIQQWECNGTAAQKWNIVKKVDNSYVLQNVATGLVMDVSCGTAANGQNIQGYLNNGTIAQSWNINPAKPTQQRLDQMAAEFKGALPNNIYTFENGKNNTLVLDVAGGSKDDGANIQLYTNNETNAQKWSVSHDEKGYVTFTNVGSKKVMDVAGAQAKAGTNIWQYSSNNTKAQKWIAVPAGENKYRIVSALSDTLQLGPNSSDLKDGTGMCLVNSTSDQSSVFVKKAGKIAKAVFDINTKSLTFYYDNESHAGTDKVVYSNLPTNATKAADWPYISDGTANDVKSVVIDDSVKDLYGLQSTAGMFGKNGSGTNEIAFKNVNSVSGLENLNVENVISMNGMFHSFAANSTASYIALDLTDWNIDSLVNADNMFACFGQNIKGTPFVYSTNWSDKVGVSAVNMFKDSKLKNAETIGQNNPWLYANTSSTGCFSEKIEISIEDPEYGTLTQDEGFTYVPNGATYNIVDGTATFYNGTDVLGKIKYTMPEKTETGEYDVDTWKANDEAVTSGTITADTTFSVTEKATNYLTFTAQADTGNSVTPNFASKTSFAYTTDNGSTWVSDSGKAISLAEDSSVKMRGEACTTDKDNHFVMDGKIAASGDVTSLTNKIGGDTQLTDSCYSKMFFGCTALTQSPVLTATQLADNCYLQMFSGCTALTQAPALPATQLADNCYFGMFYGCTALTQAPALPATQLANNCYHAMFSGCTSLTQAPALPATQLAGNCYKQMFFGCTALTQAPALPATQLANSCYQQMFQGCTKLKVSEGEPAVKTKGLICTLPSTESLINPVKDMFKNTAGTFISTPSSGKTYYWYTEKPTVKQVTNIVYGDQKVNFVPAFSDSDKSYLKDNKVDFYTDPAGTSVDIDIHNLIYGDNGCTMNELYQKLLVDPAATTKTLKTLYASAKSGVTFYGVLNEK